MNIKKIAVIAAVTVTGVVLYKKNKVKVDQTVGKMIHRVIGITKSTTGAGKTALDNMVDGTMVKVGKVKEVFNEGVESGKTGETK